MMNCQICYNKKFSLKFHYKTKPKRETDFNIKKKNYDRFYIECTNCFHLYSIMSFDLDNLYAKNYSKFTYGNNILKNFLKIKDLPNVKSDNFYRIKRFFKFFKKKKLLNKKFLDIGSGTGIFPYKLKEKNIDISCIEKDQNLKKHLIKNLFLKVINDDFKNIKLKSKFDMISLNKVLEHIEKPHLFLKDASSLLKRGGYIYFEVPDAKIASNISRNREELFIEHLQGFSMKSTKLFFEFNNFRILNIKSIHEPSGKYTIYGFAKKT